MQGAQSGNPQSKARYALLHDSETIGSKNHSKTSFSSEARIHPISGASPTIMRDVDTERPIRCALRSVFD
jgi:hypothetical protein